MAQVLQNNKQVENIHEEVFKFLDKIKNHDHYQIKEKHEIFKAIEFSKNLFKNELHRNGLPLIIHSTKLADYLLNLNVEFNVIVLAFLHETLRVDSDAAEKIRQIFGEKMKQLVEGVQRLGVIRKNNEQIQGDDLNNILTAMSQDVRITIIRLVHRLFDLQKVDTLPEEEKLHIAMETSDFYVPLAERLGIHKLKHELEDHCFRIISPDTYSEIQNLQKRTEKEDKQCLEQMRLHIIKLLKKHNIQGKVYGRVKGIYSIYRKKMKQKIAYDKVYDKLAIRIIVESIPVCYTVLGLIHTEFSLIPETFDDYIASPKSNNYQSLHTAIYPLEGVSYKPIEIQIRTQLMEQNAEFGAAAHWQYKNNQFQSIGLEEQNLWFRSLLSLKNKVDNYTNFIEILNETVNKSSTTVFDQLGKVVYLPYHATVKDFIIHLSLSDKTDNMIIKVNGKDSYLEQQLKNGDTIEVF